MPNRIATLGAANDGGANVSFNGGESWTDQDYPTAQFYRVATTRHLPYHICGGQQGNSAACIPVRGWLHMTARGPDDRTWYYAVGGVRERARRAASPAAEHLLRWLLWGNADPLRRGDRPEALRTSWRC